MSYCDWDNSSEITRRYHDEEWGVPVHDDVRQFEFLMMEVMQCGLSWDIVMRKREVFRAAFDGFDFDAVAAYGEADAARILATPGMIRSPRKVAAIIGNARCFQAVRREFGTFCDYLWGWTKGRTLLYAGHSKGRIPVSNGLSTRIADDLRRRGFKYLGPVTIYSHLQAAGLINDHDAHCPRYAAINAAHPTARARPDAEVGVVDFSARAQGQGAQP